ncbi:peptide chain release factor 1 [bacterium]|nr:peptide chain release factor 1 [bacterium]
MEQTDDNLFLAKLAKFESRMREIESSLEDLEVLKNPEKLKKISREHKTLMPVVKAASRYRDILAKIKEDSEILESSPDEELKALAREELADNEKRRCGLEEELKILLIPKDPADEKSAVFEIRAGTGGEEAALFAADLFRMYSKYIERRGWKLELLSSSPTGLGGFKEIIFSVSGEGAYGTLKLESGVHRVQRVPSTETQGRIHTSAASVVVLPEAEDVDVVIDEKDLRIDVYRSSGPGGQSVNTTDSAVRITHLPTGLVVTCQDEKSQHKNKAKALKVLRARLYDIRRKQEEAKILASRRSMIGSGDRSAKIRTFNFPQNRVTDHRIELTLYRLQEILSGEIDELIGRLQTAERNEKLRSSS